jgi:hypothetical protein
MIIGGHGECPGQRRDGPDAGRLLDRDARGAAEKLEETPLARMLVPTGYGGSGLSRRPECLVHRLPLVRVSLEATARSHLVLVEPLKSARRRDLLSLAAG